MKKAVAEFGASYIALLAEVTVLPSRLAHFPLWPKAKSLHVLHALHGELAFSVEPAVGFPKCLSCH